MTLKFGLEVTLGHWTDTILKLGCGFLFVFHSNYGFIVHYFRDKATYWSKITIDFFSYPFAFDAPVSGGGLPSEYCLTVWYRKTRMAWLHDGKKIEDTFSRFDRTPACDGQTDGRRDRHLNCDGTVCAMHSIARWKRNYRNVPILIFDPVSTSPVSVASITYMFSTPACHLHHTEAPTAVDPQWTAALMATATTLASDSGHPPVGLKDRSELFATLWNQQCIGPPIFWDPLASRWLKMHIC